MIGFGTWKLTDINELRTALSAAVEAGYGVIDTAAVYCNEISIGKALRELVINRDDVFIQSKLWITDMGFSKAQEACKRALRKLKLNHLDAYFIHWPSSTDEDLNRETFAGLQKLKRDGLIKFAGVSNFKPHHIETLETSPDINQIEFHPGFMQSEIVKFCRERNISLQAHSPLGNGEILQNPTLTEISRIHAKTIAQICLRWIIEKNITPIVKSSDPKRIKENADIFDFALGDEARKIDALEFCGGLGLDSDEVINFDQLR